MEIILIDYLNYFNENYEDKYFPYIDKKSTLSNVHYHEKIENQIKYFEIETSICQKKYIVSYKFINNKWFLFKKKVIDNELNNMTIIKSMENIYITENTNKKNTSFKFINNNFNLNDDLKILFDCENLLEFSEVDYNGDIIYQYKQKNICVDENYIKNEVLNKLFLQIEKDKLYWKNDNFKTIKENDNTLTKKNVNINEKIDNENLMTNLNLSYYINNDVYSFDVKYKNDKLIFLSSNHIENRYIIDCVNNMKCNFMFNEKYDNSILYIGKFLYENDFKNVIKIENYKKMINENIVEIFN